MRENIKLIQPN